MIGNDSAGQSLVEQFTERGVDPVLLRSQSGAGTAHCLCLVGTLRLLAKPACDLALTAGYEIAVCSAE